ncbi:hypothetical protein AMTRI_Chr07g27090 [Amborella trichopoda]
MLNDDAVNTGAPILSMQEEERQHSNKVDEENQIIFTIMGASFGEQLPKVLTALREKYGEDEQVFDDAKLLVAEIQDSVHQEVMKKVKSKNHLKPLITLLGLQPVQGVGML